MKATIYDYAKLNAEGLVFRTKTKRGWYYKDEFMGYNAHEAIEAVNAIKERRLNNGMPGLWMPQSS